MKFIDAHTHVQFKAFKDDYREVIERALQAGVTVVNVGTQRDTSKRAVEVADEFLENVWAAVGLHPIHTGKSFYDEDELGDSSTGSGFNSRGEDFDYEYYKELAKDEKVVAIGECGLDYYRVTSDMGNETKTKQKEVLIKQIELAKEVEKPLMIHCRDAYPDLLKVLKENQRLLNSPPGILHFYSGDLVQTKELVKMGFYFTFGGVVTFSRDYDEIVGLIPRDIILSETDAPYVAPVPYRGKRNEPAYVIEVVKKLAEIKGVSVEKMAEQIWKNAQAIFRI